MLNQILQNKTVTSTKKRPHEVNIEELNTTVPALKFSRQEKNSINISRVNNQVKPTPNQASLRVEVRLTLIKSLLVLLANPLSNLLNIF